MAVSRRRGSGARAGWLVQVYDPDTMKKKYIGAYQNREEALRVEAEVRVPKRSKRRLKLVTPRPPRTLDIPVGPRVYVASADEVGRIKIGYSVNTADRFRELNSTSAVELRFEFSFPGDRAMEEALHRRFQRYRVRSEWFTRGPELEAWIETFRVRRPEYFLREVA